MKCPFLFVIYFALTAFTAPAQKINLVIQINDQLIETVSNMYIMFDSTHGSKKIYTNYVPGELDLPSEAWNIIDSDSTQTFTLYFSQNTYDNAKSETKTFYINLKKSHLNLLYLILNIYDFSDKKYKKWYSWHTNKSFFAELRCNSCGMYIRKR